MNTLLQAILNNQPLTMSSLEIAELTKKDHRNVTADIRKMLETLGVALLTFQHRENNGNNNTRTVYKHNKPLLSKLSNIV